MSDCAKTGDAMDAAIDGLENWYEQALASGAGFKTQEERDAYVLSLGDPLKHPMFAQSAEDMEGHPLVEAIRAIREEDKTPVELALMYKDEGNEWMKKKDTKSQKEAYERYTHALGFVDQAERARQEGREEAKDQASDLPLLRSQLLSNRAAVSLNLKNYGSVKGDCQQALALCPHNVKAHYRLVKAHYLLREHDLVLSSSTEALKIDPENKEILEIRQQSEAERREAETKRLRILNNHFQTLKASFMQAWAIAKRLKVSLGYVTSTPEPLPLREKWPSKGEEGEVVWPLTLLYPQHNTFDVIPDANLQTMLAEPLAMIFPSQEEGEKSSAVAWDVRGEYHVEQLVAYLPLRTSLPIRSVEDWLLHCFEHYLQHQSGSIEQVQFALKTLNNGSNLHPRYGEIDKLTTEKFIDLVDKAKEQRAALLKQQETERESQVAATVSYLEVHLGCSLERIVTAQGDRNILPRGVLTLIVFPRGNAVHRKFLQAVQKENKTIEMLDPV